MNESETQRRLPTNPATTFSGVSSGEGNMPDVTWSDYVTNGVVDEDVALLLQSEFGPTEYPKALKYILDAAKRESE